LKNLSIQDKVQGFDEKWKKQGQKNVHVTQALEAMALQVQYSIYYGSNHFVTMYMNYESLSVNHYRHQNMAGGIRVVTEFRDTPSSKKQ
jgi:hypothetical protein